MLAEIHVHLGSFERLDHIVRMEDHVTSADGWVQQPAVIDGASGLLVEVLGERAGGLLACPAARQCCRHSCGDRVDSRRLNPRSALPTGAPGAIMNQAARQARFRNFALEDNARRLPSKHAAVVEVMPR